MSRNYVIKTDGGNLYEIIDESHLWHPDTWIILINKVRFVIISFSALKIRQTLTDAVAGRVDYRNADWKHLEGGVGANINSGHCIGHAAIFIKEELIKPYMRTRAFPPNFWENVIAKHYEYTPQITEVYLKIH